jgi:type IV pilus assembly protein PilX
MMHAHVHRRQHGAALIIALLMLILLLMLGVSAAGIGLQSEKMGRNLRDRQIAWQAAEATLLDAEYDIGNPDSPRRALFSQPQPETLAQCHGDGPAAGLCRPAPDPRNAVWRRMGRPQGAPGVSYGRYSGRRMQTGAGSLPARMPRYLIEILPPTAGAAPKEDKSRLYRISALGFGPDENTRVLLQSLYRRQADGSDLASARVSWREIGNWEPA